MQDDKPRFSQEVPWFDLSDALTNAQNSRKRAMPLADKLLRNLQLCPMLLVPGREEDVG